MKLGSVLEIVQFFTDVENYGNGQDQYHGKHEAAQEFAQYVPI
jgi:hypothetical protein